MLQLLLPEEGVFPELYTQWHDDTTRPWVPVGSILGYFIACSL
ncbi:hypothetical protein [Bilophila wadsworthia]|nr:hypothetical protein [Bilophila wadsworthia]